MNDIRGNRIRSLYLPYLGIVATVHIVTSLFNYLLFSRYMHLPTANSNVIIPGLLMAFALLALYRPVVVRLTSTWSDRGQGSPADIFLALPSLFVLQFVINGHATWGSFIVAFIVGQLAWIFAIMASRTAQYIADDYAALSREQLEQQIRRDFFKTFRFLTPAKNYSFTPIATLTLIGIFMIMMLSGVDGFEPTPEQLANWGSIYSPAMPGVLHYWRFLTAGLVANSIFSLAGSIVCIVLCGRLIEHMLGTRGTAFLFIFSQITGNIVGYVFGPEGTIAGPYFGVLGLLSAMFCYALFEISSEDNRGIIIMNLFICGIIAAMVGFANAKGLGEPVKGILGALGGGAIVAIYFIPVARRAKDIEPE